MLEGTSQSRRNYRSFAPTLTACTPCKARFTKNKFKESSTESEEIAKEITELFFELRTQLSEDETRMKAQMKTLTPKPRANALFPPSNSSAEILIDGIPFRKAPQNMTNFAGQNTTTLNDAVYMSVKTT